MASPKSTVRALTERAHFLWARRRLSAVGLALLFAAWVLRPLWQPAAVFAHVHVMEAVIYGAALFLLARWFARRDWLRLAALVALAGVWLSAIYWLDVSPYDYVSLYRRYRHVAKQDFAALPETAHERIQPLHSVRTLSNEVLSNTEHAAEPDIVRVDGNLCFTFAIEPPETLKFWLRRWFDPVKTVVSLPVTNPSFDFSSRTRSSVLFPTGEGLVMSRNVASAVARSLGPLRFFSYVPTDVKYLKDDAGEWVEVVSLLRWSGTLTPWPEFGGVVVFRQQPDSLGAMLSRALFGTGEWIRPEDVPKKPFLVGQNIVPYDVSRYIAESFRFKAGFTAALPGLHYHDIRVPHLPEDRNPQPYTVYATWDGEPTGKLWHYFGLEPYSTDRQGLALSLFVPADGIGPVRVVSHDEQGLFGVSTVPSKVENSRKNYFWTNSAPVEHRPFIRTVDGKRRLFWLTTVVTFKKGSAGDFIAGADPEITLTDAASQHVMWVNAKDPSSWMTQIEGELPKVTGEAAAKVAAPAPAEKAAPPDGPD